MKPAPGATAAATILLLLSLVVAWAPHWLGLWYILAAATVVLALVDLLLARRFLAPQVTRQVSHTLPLERTSAVCLWLEAPKQRSIKGYLFDFYPTDMQVKQLPASFDVPAGARQQLIYHIVPLVRGHFSFQPAQVLDLSPLRLFYRVWRLGEAEDVRVYPNFVALSQYANLLRANAGMLGVHRRRQRGEGREFHQMREYVQGDPVRHIDWKASSRNAKLICREFRDERDQQLVILLDCGRNMRTKDGDISHFDYALNAVFMLASVALHHGDSVGLMTFAGHRRYCNPRKGNTQLNTLLNQIYDIQPGLEPADFPSMAREALVSLKKRALLVIVSNPREEESEQLTEATSHLNGKHLVMVTGMRESAPAKAGEEPIESVADAQRYGAICRYLDARRRMYRLLTARGLFCIDTEPQDLAFAVINSYFQIKSSGKL